MELTKKAKFAVTAGILVARDFERHLRDYCWVHDVTLTLEKSKGVLETSFRGMVQGPSQHITNILKWINNLDKQNI